MTTAEHASHEPHTHLSPHRHRPSLAGTADARSITFGHRIDHEPNTTKPCVDDGSDTPDLSIVCTRIPFDADRGAVPAGLTAPKSGRITKFRIRPVAAGTVTFQVVRTNGNLARAVGPGLTVNLAGPAGDPEDVVEYPVETFPANVKVKRGDYVGITSSLAPALYCSHGGDNQLLFTPSLGSAFQTSTDTDSCELLVQAVMKPAKRR